MNGQPELYKGLKELNIPFEYYESLLTASIKEVEKYLN
jgi:hypothetical protein